MVSSNQVQPNTEQIYCLVRNEWVAALPEEKIRQQWLHKMVYELNYPLSGFALEKSLHQMPHLAGTGLARLPKRRADIVFFSNGIHPDHALYPLLLIECKAVKLTSKVLRQVVGYNYYLKAPFIAAVNDVEAKLGWQSNNGEYNYSLGIPTYPALSRASCASRALRS